MKNIYFPLFLLLSLFFTQRSLGQLTTVCYRVSASSDDAEQFVNPNNTNFPADFVDLVSSDLELVDDPGDGGIGQLVGIRFTDVQVPQGATITEAYIQFAVDETTTSSTSVVIRGQDADNPGTFSSATNDLSNRSVTVASVAWNSIPQWTVIGQADAAQRTPNIASVVQEIINRGGWISGSAMAFIITGTGERVAEAYDGSPGTAPQLCISYENSCPAQGTPCDDGNASTVDDREDGNCNCSGVPPIGQVCLRISSGLDDAEQIQDGSMYFNSTDIELTFDDNPNENRGNQTVGLRFPNLQIPQGAIVSNAYLQFTVDEANSEATSVTIRAEDVNNSSPFADVFNELTTRTTTSASTVWNNIPTWSTIGLAGADQRTPDLSAIIQEVTDRSGWQRGNALSFIIDGSGQRTAESYDGSPGQAALLCFEYNSCTPPPVNSIDDCYYFIDCNITNGGTVQVSCEEDLSDEAIAERFDYAFNIENEETCDFCNNTKTVVLKRSRGINFNTPKQTATKSNTAVCYTEQITWENLCVGDNNIVLLSATIEVIDPSPPTFDVPSDVITSCEDNIYDLSITGNATHINDNCGIASIEYEDAINTQTINCNTGSIVTRTWKVTDECGNITTKTQTITVNPSVSCITTNGCIQNDCGYVCGQTVRLTGDEGLSDAAIQGLIGSCFYDDCNAESLSFSRKKIGSENNPVPGSDFCVRFREELKWSLGSETFILILEVIDIDPPTFTVPAAAHVFCDEIHDLSKTGIVTDAADINGSVTISFEDDKEVSDCSSETLVTRYWKVTDECGNETVKEQSIIVYPRGCNLGFDIDTVGFANEFIEEGSYLASTKAVSFSEIAPNTTVNLFGGESVELLPGFHARPNSEFRAAIVTCNSNIPLNDLCTAAFDLTLGNPLSFGNGENATKADSYNLELCAYDDGENENPNPGIWFRFLSPITGEVEIKNDLDIEDSDDISRLRVYEGDCNDLTFLDCSSYFLGSFFSIDVIRQDPILIDVEAGKEYFIYLDNVYDIDVEEYAILVTDVSSQENNPVRTRQDEAFTAVEFVQIFPNVVQETATISYRLAQDGTAQLDIFDLKGNHAQALLHTTQKKGEYQVDFRKKVLPAGMYLVRLQTAAGIYTKRLVIHE